MGVAQYDVRPVSLAMQMPPEMQLKQVTRKMSNPRLHKESSNSSKKLAPLQGNKVSAVQQS